MITDSREEVNNRLVVAIILAIAVFCFFQFTLPYHLFLKEQTQLYLLTANHFLSYFAKPAWMARNLGEFLTQFFFLRGGGATVLTLLFLVEWVLVMYLLRSFRIHHFVPLYALFPVVAEWIMHTTLEYQVSHTLSVTLLLFFYGLYTLFRNKWSSWIVGLLLGGILYSLVGVTALLFPLFVIVYDAVNKRKSWLFWPMLIALTVFVPYQLRNTYLLTEEQAWIYPFTKPEQLLPVVLLIGCIPLLLLDVHTKVRRAERHLLLVLLLLLLFLAGGLVKSVDLEREKVLAFSTETYFNSRSRVDELIEKYAEEKNDPITYYTNIALAERNELPEKLLNYYQPMANGLFLPVGPRSSWLTIFFSNDVHFMLGNMTIAEHSAMLGMIFSPGSRSSRMVKRLAEINLVNEDAPATRKYLRMLDATLFHRKWAAEQELLLQEGDSTTNGWLLNKRLQRPVSDTLSLAGDYQKMLTLLVESNPENRQALDYLLCYYLLNKDIPSFMMAYDRWCKGKSEYIPALYSEALLIYLASGKASEKEVQSYQIPANKMADFVKYTQLFEESEGNGTLLQEEFGRTYWFYMHFAQMVKQ